MQIKPLYDQQDIRFRAAIEDQQTFTLFFNYHWPQVYGTGLRLTNRLKRPGILRRTF